jgi:hypothetical protein
VRQIRPENGGSLLCPQGEDCRWQRKSRVRSRIRGHVNSGLVPVISMAEHDALHIGMAGTSPAMT